MTTKRKSSKKTTKSKNTVAKKQKQQRSGKSEKKHFTQLIFGDWCKACGICIAFCPENVFGHDESGKPVVERADDCNNCLFCELHCPDFAITIDEKPTLQRRESNDGK